MTWEILRGRRVDILVDANVATSPRVQKAELDLALHLSSVVGASVTCHRLPVGGGVNGPDDYLAAHTDRDYWRLMDAPGVEPWLAQVGESYERYINAQPPVFVIKEFLQTEGLTIIAGLSGHTKTWLLLSMAQCLLTGEKLFGHFSVVTKATRVLYLTPEITLGSFKTRAEKFGLGEYVKNGMLLVRTLSAYPIMPLTDPAVLMCAKGADVFLDPAIRFMTGDESSSSDNANGLAEAVFQLLQAGARTVIAAHHSPKSFETANYMSLENVLRGSGDIGAMSATVWGVRMLDAAQTKVQVENVKPRDFTPPPPFQLQGRPHIDNGKGMQMVSPPGSCGTLRNYVEAKKGGRPPSPAKAERA